MPNRERLSQLQFWSPDGTGKLRELQLLRTHCKLSARRPDTTTRYELTDADGSYEVEVVRADDGFHVTVGRRKYFLKLKHGPERDTYVAEMSEKPISVVLIEANNQRVEMKLNGDRLAYQRPVAAIKSSQQSAPTASVQKNLVTAPMPGRVIGILVKKGERVNVGDPLVIIESMKMETAVRSDRDGEVEETMVEEGTTVKRGQPLVRFRS